MASDGQGGQPKHRTIPLAMYLGLGTALVLIPVIAIMTAPDQFQQLEFFLKVIAALGGGLIGAGLPGLFRLKLPYAEAAGAMAVFLLIFAVNPPRIAEGTFPANLKPAAEKFTEVATNFRNSKTIRPNTALPSDLTVARSSFEGAWAETNLAGRREVPPKVIYDAVSLNAKTYRLQEIDSTTKASSNHWADEAINYFREINDRHYLVESLLDKAAIFLEISQLEHTEGDEFRALSKEGDAVLADAYTAAEIKQRPTILRLWSRFYYNLARPKSNQLHENWDSDYLRQAYEKALQAYQVEPTEIRNATQLARSAEKAAGNPPYDRDPAWLAKLIESRDFLRVRWAADQTNKTDPMERIPPLNILGVMTLRIAEREWASADEGQRPLVGAKLLRELDDIALSAQSEALALIPNTELRREFDFDLRYDLARMWGMKAQILAWQNDPKSADAFDQSVRDLQQARVGATTTQLDSAYASIETVPSFVGLSEERRTRLKIILTAAAH